MRRKSGSAPNLLPKLANDILKHRTSSNGAASQGESDTIKSDASTASAPMRMTSVDYGKGSSVSLPLSPGSPSASPKERAGSLGHVLDTHTSRYAAAAATDDDDDDDDDDAIF